MAQKLKVFLSWAGETSKNVAIALNEWLPQVLQNVEPWFSSEDIDKGGQWATALSEILENARVGIICLTPDNLSNTWIHFEVGALWKALSTSRVCPFLFNIRQPTDVKFPIGMFQSTRATEKDEVRRLLRTLNSILSEDDSHVSESRLDKTFEKWWPELEARLAQIAASTPPIQAPLRDVGEMVSELLEHVRGLTRRLDSAAGSEPMAPRLPRAEPVPDLPDTPKDQTPPPPGDPDDAAPADPKAEG